MEESITFWLDNKICSGFKIAEIGKQTLVLYRDKYYIIVSGAAQMKGVRPLHYSKSSMPLIWRKAMKGILPQPAPDIVYSEDGFLPVSTSTKKEKKAMNKESTDSPSPEERQSNAKSAAAAPRKSAAADLKPAKIIQAAVSSVCPYCSYKQDIPFEKGKNGKPFFVSCAKCTTDFAVRFVPVTMYQAQTAAFK